MKTLSLPYFNRIVEQYQLNHDWTVEIRDSGMNNTTRFLVAPGGEIRILRIYENHRDVAKLRYEHDILLQLRTMELPFACPLPYFTREGDTYITCLDGKLAALFTYIDGRRPRDKEAPLLSRALGQAAAELTLAMQQIVPQHPAAYPPYYELSDSYEEAAAEIMSRLATDPKLAELGADMLFLLDKLAAFRALRPAFEALPQQIIHGDFSCSNLLMANGRITGVLDYEFATRDMRAMELAVCLGETIGRTTGMDTVEQLLTGFGSRLKLNPQERHVLPELIRLRKLDVFLHFWNRYVAGLDPIPVLREQIRRSVDACRYLDMHQSGLAAAINRFLS